MFRPDASNSRIRCSADRRQTENAGRAAPRLRCDPPALEVRILVDRVQQAWELLDAGRPDAASAVLLRALKAAPRDARANNLLSAILSRQGENTRALFYAERAAEASPQSAVLHSS